MALPPLLPRARCLDLLLMPPSSAMGMGKLKQIHAQMVVGGSLRRPNALGKLIERYAAVSAPAGMDHARLAFRCHAGDADVFAWNVVIRCSAPRESILLYAGHCDQKGGRGCAFVPDDRTLTYVFGACARSAALWEGMQVHAQIVKTRAPGSLDAVVLTTGVHFYGSLGDVESARRLFEEMPKRNSPTWNALMAGYCLKGMAAEATALFKEMLREERLEVRPTDRSMVVLLNACSQLGELASGSSVHAYICKAFPFEDDTFLGTGLVDMYSKCGCLSSARKAFEGTKEKNVLTWTVMIAGLAFHGRGEAAIKMLEAMLDAGISPNAVTFTCLLSACCHAGLVDEGLLLFEMMSSRFGMAPGIQHYGCVVDLLGRVGMVGEARSFVRNLPIPPDAVLWRTLLAACKVHGHARLGEEIGESLLQLEQAAGESQERATTCEDYVALSNMYASDGRWGDVWRLREMMKGLGVQNRSGSSSLQINKQGHQIDR
ncbi:hypothetical protein Taro_022802 [Colocasia esculenta]|uniref:Pentatricopeptide repeat-containing protein n=1 Tax=Colocasia esculenta TaxID=4460 RepID=A0A843UVG0_COLES|nr:hypothetical protein [Colocasia esculenta]